ncbi:hypothetical protein DYB30_006869 [Aphanomyces astaci]|uniref:Cytochrome c oxidase copper chaperone n=2 Tax=Aphanomyces astaci TaxID=112090 RepID=A0A397DN04_APHAT|nr:hypothetical protein DYB38_007574 [Aphanomyces astaci]RHY70002.1 hypothetical protein DYB30_006869 [Aphanomyces astaci]RHZ05088.1 hypothetical protein DYB26_000839 [Aphanomyces astaci]RHZ39857.1 hypothetical protein DYB31_008795 [Aphanomyces astaci]
MVFVHKVGTIERTLPKSQVAMPDITATAAAPILGKSGKRICCSCPDTKSVRDLCVLNNGEENCADVIEAHKQCLRAEGFKVK